MQIQPGFSAMEKANMHQNTEKDEAVSNLTRLQSIQASTVRAENAAKKEFTSEVERQIELLNRWIGIMHNNFSISRSTLTSLTKQLNQVDPEDPDSVSLRMHNVRTIMKRDATPEIIEWIRRN